MYIKFSMVRITKIFCFKGPRKLGPIIKTSNYRKSNYNRSIYNKSVLENI